ncbi:MAG: DUF3943 domain-containing protein [Nitrospirales bacterium]
MTGVLVLVLLISAASSAQELPSPTLYGPFSAEPASGSSQAFGPLRLAVDSGGTRNDSLDAIPSVGAEEVPPFSLTWEKRPNRSYLIPALEIPLYAFLLNQFDRNFTDPEEEYRTTGHSIKENITDGKWVVDNDQFSVNQFLHPYGGTIYFGLARSASLNFWESSLAAATGSLIWELGGERTRPSINDQFTTTFGGIFLGEPLFRMANLLLESDEEGEPGFWRELAAGIISPPTAFNRFVFGNRFDAIYPSHKPATFMRLQVGGTLTSGVHNVSSNVKTRGAIGDVTIRYGLPGKPGYSYSRPFDYFDFHFTAVTANAVESVNTHGLLIGNTYAASASTRGVWGLYGSYDYINPQVFRVSTSALSLGTTWQSWLSEDVAVQGTALGGAGYGAAGSIKRTGNRDYHYGFTPQALLALRLIMGDRLMIDFTGQEYYVSGLLSSESHGRENILRGNASLTLRIIGRHGIALRYVASQRNASYSDVDYHNQTVGTLSLMYVLLGSSGFGAVEWR